MLSFLFLKKLVENERKIFMAIKVTESAEKITPAKKTVKITDVYLKDLKFVDEEGDITQQVVDALPEGTEKVSFSITVELPSDEDSDFE